MKLNSNFILHSNADENILLDVTGKFSGMIRCNATSAKMIEILQKECTFESLVEQLMQEYDVEKSIIEADAKLIVEKLKSVGAIDE